MRLLTVTTLYPNSASPAHGVFVENRLDAWKRRHSGDVRVLAPVPWFPFSSAVFGRYARFAAAPAAEVRRGISVAHPRYFLPPKIGMDYAPTALARVMLREARAQIAAGRDFDIIDAHYLYPDGVAAVRTGKALGKPVILTARGSDVTQLAAFPRQRAMILDAIWKSDAVIAVAAALKDDLVRLGAPAEKIEVLRNGVDLELFRPLDRNAIRARMGLSGPVIASVGGLIARKGHDIAIDAIADFAGATLLIVGDGEEKRRLIAQARANGVADRVRFLGALPHEELAEIYNAADALVLASSREGWPNVLLEAMACGTPAVASDAGGCREVIRAPEAGRIVGERVGAAFAGALKDVIARADRAATRRYAQAHSWDETSDRLQAIFRRVHADRQAPIQVKPSKTPREDRPRLIFSIDTEEAFDWSSFDPDRFRVLRTEGLLRLQALLEEFRVRPIYFITYPLITDAENAGFFRRLAEEGRADLGLHLHQWTTPPFGGYRGEYYSWQCNLPREVQTAKLKALADAFRMSFGFAPVAHRAGRYGVDARAYRALAATGISHDFSPSAAFDFSAEGGPDFSAAGNHPFTVETPEGDVSVTPVCGALAVRGGRAFIAQPPLAGLASARRRAPRILTAPFRLSCEQARFEELVALTRHLAKAKTPVLTFSLHSTTLTPGGNAYAPDEAAVDAALALTRRYLEYFVNNFGGEAADLRKLDALYEGARRQTRDAAAF